MRTPSSSPSPPLLLLPLLILLSLSLLPTLTTAYNTAIIFHISRPTIPPTQRGQILGFGFCTHVPPSFCCLPLTPHASQAGFNALPPGAIAAVWQPRGILTGCDGRILQTHYVGMPMWSFWNTNYTTSITGANYVQCGIAEAVNRWLGILGGYCPGKRRRMRRGWIGGREEEEEGRQWGYPDIVSFGGRNYTDERRGDLLYRDEGGRVLDLGLLK